MTGTLAGALAARKIPTQPDKLSADVEGVVLLAASIADSAGRRGTPALEDLRQASEPEFAEQRVGVAGAQQRALPGLARTPEEEGGAWSRRQRQVARNHRFRLS